MRDGDTTEARQPIAPDVLRWIEHVHELEYVHQSVPRRTGAVAIALAMLDRELPLSSRDIGAFGRMGHETVRRGCDALQAVGLIDRHRRPLPDRRGPALT